MTAISSARIRSVGTFHELVDTPFEGRTNAIQWPRRLTGDFAEIVNKIALTGNLMEVSEAMLRDLPLSDRGQLARDNLLGDLQALTAHGAAPVLNLIRSYERDDDPLVFPTDVYSFHVDRSPVPAATFLCTYHGAPSDILPNDQGEQKILVPEIRAELKSLYDGPDAGFEAFLSEYFFDLHYRAKPGAEPISLGTGHLWRLACDHPGSEVPPCLHRAPVERDGKTRLLLIC